jgi:hypothetical protein
MKMATKVVKIALFSHISVNKVTRMTVTHCKQEELKEKLNVNLCEFHNFSLSIQL